MRKDVHVDVEKMKKDGDYVTATKRDVVEDEDEEIEDDDDPVRESEFHSRCFTCKKKKKKNDRERLQTRCNL